MHAVQRFMMTYAMLTAAAAVPGQAQPSFAPLNDLGSGLYLDQFEGGLYPGGSNDVPAEHTADGLRRAAAIQPLDALGGADPDGKYVLMSIGMSNTNQEFGPFINQAAAHPDVNHNKLVIVNGAQGGQPAESWISPDAETYDRARQRLGGRGVTEAQVSVIWLKQANPRPEVSLPAAGADAFTLVEHLGDIVRAAKVRYPNLEVVLLSSRIYAGYATTMLNPEPYAYESGFAVKWLIEAQLNQMNGGGIDPLAGDLDYTSGVAPWLAWGPYLWADGLNPRSDGLIWEQTDFQSDGTHPALPGEEKVASLLLEFMLDSPFTRPWFSTAVLGDYTGDGNVDAADYTVWQDTFGSTSDLAADGDASGTVDAGDYDVWKTHYGETAGIGSILGAIGSTRLSSPKSASDRAPVPEPAAFWTLATSGIAFVVFSRGRLGEHGSTAALRHADRTPLLV